MKLKLLKLLKITLLLATFLYFSFSSAQSMFFHLLPGFVPAFTWVGLGADANWTTAGNWSTGAIPGAANTAIFDFNCTVNCNPTINASISVGGFNIKSTYAGTITQGAGNTITIGTTGWTQQSGTFVGSDANINFTGNLLLSGTAVFNSTSAQTYFDLAIAANTNIITAPAGTTLTFPNSSTARFRIAGACGRLLYGISSVQKISFFNLTTESYGLGCGASLFGNSSGTLEIRNDYSHTSADGLYPAGAFEVYGNFSVAGWLGDEGSLWTAMGAVSKTYTGPGGIGKLVVAKTGGASLTPSNATQTFLLHALDVQTGVFTLPQTLNMLWTGQVTADHFKIASGTTVNVPANSLVAIQVWGACGSPSKNIDVDSVFNFENLTLTSTGNGCGPSYINLAVGDTLVVKKDLILGDVANNANLTVEGSVNVTGSPGGTMALTLTNGNSKTFTQSTATITTGTITINKPSGTITASSNLTFNNAGQDLTISNGTLNLNGRTLLVNDSITVAAGGKLICAGGTATAGSWTIVGEVSCPGTGQGITWTGSTGDNLWSTAGNWTGGVVPGSSDIAIFNGSCAGANCNAQIDSNVSVRGLNLTSSYTGTLTQNATRTLTVGTAGYMQAGGTFAGGNAAVNMNGTFNLSGGTYTATSATWTQVGNMTISGAPTFNHNSGSWITIDSPVIVPNGIILNNVEFAGWATFPNLSGGTLVAAGHLRISDTNNSWSLPLDNGTIEARGDITTSSFGKTGTVLIRINGTGAQTLTGTSGSIPAIEINKASGTLTLSGTIKTNKNFTYLAGTVDAGTSTLMLDAQSGSQSVTPGSVVYNHVTFGGYQGTQNLNAGTMIVAGTLLFQDTYSGGGINVNNGNIDARGDITTSNFGKNGSAIVRINGTGAQLLTGIAGNIPSVEINKASGTLTLTGTITTAKNFTYTAGTVDAGTSTLVFNVDSATQQVIPGSVIYNNVTIGGYGSIINLNAGTMVVGGNLIINDAYISCYVSCVINNGTIEARGNITTTSAGKLGSAVVRINGTGAQLLTGTSGYMPGFEINKASGTLTLAGTIKTAGKLEYIAGTVDAGTSTIHLYTDNTGQSITPGPVVYNNFTFSGFGTAQNLNGGTLITSGTLTLSDDHNSGSVTNGTLEARGHVVVSNNGKLGSAIINFTGTTATNFTWTAGTFLSTTPIVAKTGGGSVVLATNSTFPGGQNFTISTGTLDLSGYDLAVTSTLTVSVGATLKCNGGEFTAGTLTNAGTVNCPGYATYDFNWTGAGGDVNFNTAGNWQGGVAPAANDLVVFQDTYCGATCNSTVNASTSIKGVRLRSPYTGTVTQGAGNTLTIGTRGWNQAAGTFAGGNSAISNNGTFSQSSGTFTSTSGTLTQQSAIWNISGGTFNHNNGTVTIDLISAPFATLTPSAATYNNVSFITWAGSYSIIGTLNVAGDLQFGSASGTPGAMSNGTIAAVGNITNLNNGIGPGSPSTVILVSGTGSQTLTGSSGAWPALQINKPSGTVSLSGILKLQGPLTYTAGTVSPGTSTVNFTAENVSVTHFPNGINLANVGFNFTYNNSTLNFSNQTLNIANTATFASSWSNSNLNSGIINASGNVIQTGTNSIAGTATVNLTGTIDTTITPVGGIDLPGSTTINKTSGAKVTLLGNTRFNNAGQNLTITAGTLDMAGFNLTVGNNISNSGTLKRGNNPGCGTITQGGSYSGAAAICP